MGRCNFSGRVLRIVGVVIGGALILTGTALNWNLENALGHSRAHDKALFRYSQLIFWFECAVCVCAVLKPHPMFNAMAAALLVAAFARRNGDGEVHGVIMSDMLLLIRVLQRVSLGPMVSQCSPPATADAALATPQVSDTRLCPLPRRFPSNGWTFAALGRPTVAVASFPRCDVKRAGRCTTSTQFRAAR